MYLRFYQLNQEPFQVTPDPDFLFPSRTHREALAAIVYGVEQRKGFIAVTGDVGLGKTTVLRSYLTGPHGREARAVYIYDPNVTFDELLSAIYLDLDLPPRPRSTFEALRGLHRALIAFYEARETVVLVVDEAQNMPEDTLESLRMLSNLETSSDKLIQIILCGQSEFEERLRRRSLRQLQQRIAVWARLKPLSFRDSADYIRHRLDKASFGSTPIMTKGAVNLIARASRGVPRTLNVLADNVLITGFGYDKRPVTAEIAKEVIADQQRTLGRAPPPWRPAAAAGAVAAAVALLVVGVSQVEQKSFGELMGVAEAKTAAAARAGMETIGWLSGQSTGGLSDLAGRITRVFAEPVAETASNATAADSAPASSVVASLATAKDGESNAATAPSQEPTAAPAKESQAPAAPAVSTPAEAAGPGSPPTGVADKDAGRAETAETKAPESPSSESQTAATKTAATKTAAPETLPSEPIIEPKPAKAVSTPDASDTASAGRGSGNRDSANRSKKKRGWDEELQPVEEANYDPPLLQPGDAVWTVHYGDTASKIIIEVYGGFSPALLRLVRDANPHIRDLNVLDRGDQLILPMALDASPRHLAAERYGR